MGNLFDRSKMGLSFIGAVLLVLLCAELLTGPGRTTANIIFAAVFLILLGYAVMRFFKKKGQ